MTAFWKRIARRLGLSESEEPAGEAALQTSALADMPKGELSQTEAQPERGVPHIGEVGNVHHMGRRPDQQDAFGVSSLQDEGLIARKGVLAVLADGMGGLQNSGEISRAMVSGALGCFGSMKGGQRQTLIAIAAAANRHAAAGFAGGRTGTTFIAASIFEGKLDFISIGDSRIVLLRGGALLTLNRLHNYAAELDEAAARGEISFSEADSNGKRASLTSYLGTRSLKAVDIPAGPITLLPGDQVVLMTDGVFGTLSDEEIAAALAVGAVRGAQTLEEQILSKEKRNQDNFTAIILEIK